MRRKADVLAHKDNFRPMTETGFYILYCLQEEMHSYNITQKVKEKTSDEVIISAGNMYGRL